MPDVIDPTRAAFEACIRSETSPLGLARDPLEGKYLDTRTELRWVGWQDACRFCHDAAKAADSQKEVVANECAESRALDERAEYCKWHEKFFGEPAPALTDDPHLVDTFWLTWKARGELSDTLGDQYTQVLPPLRPGSRSFAGLEHELPAFEECIKRLIDASDARFAKVHQRYREFVMSTYWAIWKTRALQTLSAPVANCEDGFDPAPALSVLHANLDRAYGHKKHARIRTSGGYVWPTFEAWLQSNIPPPVSLSEYARVAFEAGRATKAQTDAPATAVGN